MKHHNGCSDCVHNKGLGLPARWRCVEAERLRIEAKYSGSVFNCFDYKPAPHTITREALEEIVAETPSPRLPYGKQVVSIARNALTGALHTD